MKTPSDHKLLAIVGVNPEHRVQCAQPGCGHSVYARVHIVLQDGELLVLGSTCFERRYGSATALGAPSFGGTGGRQLTAEERALLVHNTAELLAGFEQERIQELSLAAARLEELRRMTAQLPLSSPPLNISRWASHPGPGSATPAPWPWMKPISSMLYIRLKDGTGWARVERRDRQQFIVPWPTFDGWDEALPAHLGTADIEHGGYAIKNAISALNYLRTMSEWEKVCGTWREMLGMLAKHSA